MDDYHLWQIWPLINGLLTNLLLTIIKPLLAMFIHDLIGFNHLTKGPSGTVGPLQHWAFRQHKYHCAQQLQHSLCVRIITWIPGKTVVRCTGRNPGGWQKTMWEPCENPQLQRSCVYKIACEVVFFLALVSKTANQSLHWFDGTIPKIHKLL